MTEQLPDLDVNSTFVVVDDLPVGPMPMRAVLQSVRDGERIAHSLVWWDGLPDWLFIDEHAVLQILLAAPSGTNAQADATAPIAASTAPESPASPSNVSAPEQKQEPKRSLTGLFSADAREGNGLSGSTVAPSIAMEAMASARSSLESAEEREPLPAISRHESLAAALSGPAAHTTTASATAMPSTSEDDLSSTDDEIDSELPSQTDDEVNPIVDLATDEPVTPSEPALSKHDKNFEEMVEKSVVRKRRLEWDTRVDELVLSGCIAAVTERGYLAMDLSSRETDHRVLFESEKDSRYVILEIVPLPQVNAAGEPVGRHLQVTVSWGQDVTDVDTAFAVVRSLASDAEKKPGKVRAEIDTATARVYTLVDLIWAAEDFVSPDYHVDSDALDDAVAAALHILERRWYKILIRRR